MDELPTLENRRAPAVARAGTEVARALQRRGTRTGSVRGGGACLGGGGVWGPAEPPAALNPPDTLRNRYRRRPRAQVRSLTRLGARLAAPRKREGLGRRGWRNTAGNLIELFWLKQAYHGPQFTGVRVKNRRVRFHRILDLKQYHFDSVPPTSHGTVSAPVQPRWSQTRRGILLLEIPTRGFSVRMKSFEKYKLLLLDFLYFSKDFI